MNYQRDYYRRRCRYHRLETWNDLRLFFAIELLKLQSNEHTRNAKSFRKTR